MAAQFESNSSGPVDDGSDLAVAPEILEWLKSADPRQAERIISVWEDQSRHLISHETRGQHYAFILVCAALAAAVICAALGQPWVASAIGISAFAGIGMTGIFNLIRRRIN